MIEAAENGHETIVQWSHEWGTTQFLWAVELAAKNGYENITRLYREWEQETVSALCQT